jgi:hypothetical protein
VSEANDPTLASTWPDDVPLEAAKPRQAASETVAGDLARS